MNAVAYFFSEMKRRNVWRAALAWLALAWLLIAIADLLFPAFGFPDAIVRWLIIGLGLGVFPVMLVAWLFELTPEGLRFDRGPQQESPENVRVGRRTDQLTIVLLLLAVGFSAVKQFVLPQRVSAPVEATAPAPAPPPAVLYAVPVVPAAPVDPRSIAVLPFANLSPEPDNAYFADGMAEELLNVLARIDGLKVASRTSSFALRDEAMGAREIAAHLGVAHLVEGSVRRQGDRLRITAQLVRAEDDQRLWADSFDRQLTDVFSVQEEITQAIADALGETLGVRAVQVRRATDDLEAYEFYLRGRQLFAQRGSNLLPARELLESAVARDPRFAEAWAVLAAIHVVMPSYFAEASADEAHDEARAAATRALAIVPQQPEALAVSARLAAERGERLDAVRLMQRSLAGDPNNANSWMWNGLTLLEGGHVGAARASFEKARRLDPLSGIHLGWLGATLAIEGETEAAKTHLRRARELGWRGPASAWLLKIAQAEGDHAEAAARYEDWLRDDGRIAAEHLEVHRAIAPAVTDPARRDEARELLLQAAEQWPEQEWVQLFLFVGLEEEALAEALRAKPLSGQILLMMVWSPADRSFREQPRFLELAEARGLLAFWEAAGWPDYCRRVAASGEHVAANAPHLECER
ncbi:hypothetical protein [Wenzhouxiangella sp. XN24]|uniref:tetratricopeptide repeat protein n=1 Tax=Wenzhouxiangella sp. XN24 TaxID=2713569 RepID=UPI0013EBE2D4|nr:hypothetical protein [Wenzhouxiangella sp. XN24]NGX15846.1 hypothetical protein [Wenzhouxiangella sp. XN24]